MNEQNAKSIFMAAVEKYSADQWPVYLDGICGADVELRAEVEKLLEAHAEMGSIHEAGLAQTIDRSVTEQVGTQIGPYKLLQEAGRGGMGVVYMAEQKKPVKRRVALKIIKPGMDTQQVIARFEAERQALAMMDHPNIAKVLDAGATESGRPYFVMELVNGIPLTDYSDEGHLTPKERLQLFLPVCLAVQHAHQKGIIHRDLKPSNVLVALYDGQPVPKVIDFGVAKATTQSLTEKTLFTQLGQVMGTIEYMSPEQAQRNQLDIDTRSDIYSLGVLLYELLTGTTPFDKQRLRSAAFDEMLRIIREEEPPRPSIRLSSIETLPSVAASRRTEPKRLTTSIRGELDWIVMKALEKDRSRRYETANGFAADVERFLNNEAVSACPPSATYRLRKFVRRHRGPLGATTALLVCIALMGTALAIARARNAERQAINVGVASLDSIRGIILPPLSEFDGLPADPVLAELRTAFNDSTGQRKLALAYGLAHFGEVRLDYFASRIGDVSSDESQNLATALAMASDEAQAALRRHGRACDAEETWRTKARMAILAWHLGDPSLAFEMCRLRRDPIQRTVFIDELTTWYVDVMKLCELSTATEDSALRGAIAFGVGSIEPSLLTDEAKQAWRSVWAEWYQNEPQSGTSLAARWALQRWQIGVPEIQSLNESWYINSVGMTLVRISSGQFSRKKFYIDPSSYREDLSQEDEAKARQEQSVALTRDYWVATTEVTRRVFEQFISDDSYPNEEKLPSTESSIRYLRRGSPTADHPVNYTDWQGAVLFCNWLSHKEGLQLCYERRRQGETHGEERSADEYLLVPNANGYRLPTEAEWEYACRAGTVTRFSFGDDESYLRQHAVYQPNSDGGTSIPGTKLPNPWGLLDMHGNVAEWCQERFGPYETSDLLIDPVGSEEFDPNHDVDSKSAFAPRRWQNGRVKRGGSLINSSPFVQSSTRNPPYPQGNPRAGLRVVRSHIP